MRKIEPALVDFIDKKLAANGLAAHAIEVKDARTVFRLAAESCVGIKETGGNNKGPLVELMQKTVDGSVDREPWCLCFIESMLAYAELKTGVISPVASSEHCLTVWRETSLRQRVVTVPAPGAIIIWRHGGSDSGHTGMVTAFLHDANRMHAVEGNTEAGIDPSGGVVRDGGGVYATLRGAKGTGSMKVLGFLKPF